jgi:hypothetical protein
MLPYVFFRVFFWVGLTQGWAALQPARLVPADDPIVGTWSVVELEEMLAAIKQVPPRFESSWPTVEAYRARVKKEMDGREFVFGVRPLPEVTFHDLSGSRTTRMDSYVKGKHDLRDGWWTLVATEPRTYNVEKDMFPGAWGYKMIFRSPDEAEISYSMAYTENEPPPRVRVILRKKNSEAAKDPQ